MSFASTLGTRSLLPSAVAAPIPGSGAVLGVQTANTVRIPAVQPVSLQSDTVSLSKQGLLAQNAELGRNSLEAAQKFMAAYARQLLGRNVPGASTSFSGNTDLVTEDGQEYTVELDVRYTAPNERNPVPAPDALALTGKPLPAIAFPGSLNDLFRLLGRELSAQLDGEEQELPGTLTLRLLRLVDRAALLAPRAQPDDMRSAVASYASTARIEA